VRRVPASPVGDGIWGVAVRARGAQGRRLASHGLAAVVRGRGGWCAVAKSGVQREAASGMRRGARQVREVVREEVDWDLGFFLGP
jgi:hypothetical protein